MNSFALLPNAFVKNPAKTNPLTTRVNFCITSSSNTTSFSSPINVFTLLQKFKYSCFVMVLWLNVGMTVAPWNSCSTVLVDNSKLRSPMPTLSMEGRKCLVRLLMPFLPLLPSVGVLLLVAILLLWSKYDSSRACDCLFRSSSSLAFCNTFFNRLVSFVSITALISVIMTRRSNKSLNCKYSSNEMMPMACHWSDLLLALSISSAVMDQNFALKVICWSTSCWVCRNNRFKGIVVSARLYVANATFKSKIINLAFNM